MMNADQLQTSQKVQLHHWFEMADKSLDEAEKLMDLHLSACRQTLQEMAHCCQNACEIRDMPGVFNWQTGAFKPFAERSAEYGSRLMSLASGSGLDLGRSFEAQWESLGRQLNAWMGPSMWPVPSGQGSSVDYLRNTMQAFDSVWDGMRQNMVQSQQLMGTRPQAGHKAAVKGAARKTGH